MQSEVSDFLRYCRLERRLADLTCSAYERDVTSCMSFLEGEGFSDWRAVRPPDLRSFLAHEAETRPAASSQARTVAALKGFFRFCLENEHSHRDPALVLRTPKKREALPDVLDRRELARLLAVTERVDLWQRHFPGKRERDKLMLALFAFAGLRRSELLDLDWDDVNLERRTISYPSREGRPATVVPLHPALVPLVVDYAAVRAADPEPALFVGVQGKRLSQTPSRRRSCGCPVLRASARVSRLRRTPSATCLRPNCCIAGANLRQIQELLGHKHLDSTQRYTRVTAHELSGAVKRLHSSDSAARLPRPCRRFVTPTGAHSLATATIAGAGCVR